MRRLTTAASAALLSLAMPAGSLAQPPAVPAIPSPAAPAKVPDPTYTIALKTRHACVTPHAHKLARVEGGFIDVETPVPNTVVATMTGTAAANSYLGCTGTATETFQLVQDFEITGSDPSVRTVALTLDTALVGFVRSKGRAGAWVRRAEVSVTPVDRPGMPLVQAHPSLTVEGTGGQLCNQHLPPLEGPAMPVGRYTLVATFVLDTRASGVCDSHAVADFSPDTSLPVEWVRTRDPFQGVSKRSFGFRIMVSAAPPSTGPSASALNRNRPPAIGPGTEPSSDLADRRARRTSS
jgi:hypothetical protein